jgi:hypothetical protein
MIPLSRQKPAPCWKLILKIKFYNTNHYTAKTNRWRSNTTTMIRKKKKKKKQNIKVTSRTFASALLARRPIFLGFLLGSLPLLRRMGRPRFCQGGNIIKFYDNVQFQPRNLLETFIIILLIRGAQKDRCRKTELHHICAGICKKKKTEHKIYVTFEYALLSR